MAAMLDRPHRPSLKLLVVLAALGLGDALSFAGGAGETEPGTRPSQEFIQSFKGERGQSQAFELFGPDAEQCVRFEPDGLRITLPAAYPKVRPNTGVVLRTEVKGDFEVTVDFEVLKEPVPADTGYGTRLTLEVGLNRLEKHEATTLSRTMRAQGSTHFVTWSSLARTV